MGLVLLTLLLNSGGCIHTNSAVQPVFNRYDRVAILGELDRETETLLLEAWKEAFPSQILVERREFAAAVGTENLCPDRLNRATRTKLRKQFGVKALVYPNLASSSRKRFAAMSTRRLALKVVDTETGHTVAAAWCDGNNAADGMPLANKLLVKGVVDALRAETPPAK